MEELPTILELSQQLESKRQLWAFYGYRVGPPSGLFSLSRVGRTALPLLGSMKLYYHPIDLAARIFRSAESVLAHLGRTATGFLTVRAEKVKLR